MTCFRGPAFGLLGRTSCIVSALVAAAACGAEREPIPTDPAATPPPAASASPSEPARCDVSAVRDVAVASYDLNGYPPYAVAECSLVYVSSVGELRLRDLSTAAETVLAPASERPRRPSVSVDVDGASRNLVIAWESTTESGSIVRVRYGERLSTIRGHFVTATEPRVRERFVVFTAWMGEASTDDTDVWLFDARTDAARLAIGGPGQQRFADVSSTHVVATDFSEDPDGNFGGVDDLADILVLEIASDKLTRRAAPGKQAFPMVSNGGALAYLSWSGVHPEPKLAAYELKAGLLAGDPASDRTVANVKYSTPEPARPALAGETIEWIANPDGVTTLYRAPMDGSAAPVRVAGLDDLLLYAPATSSGIGGAFTVLATSTLAESARADAPLLRAVVR